MAVFGKYGPNCLNSNASCWIYQSLQLDGHQTICKNGGECIGFQGRKAAHSCNSSFLAGNQGLMLACSYPIPGQHHDIFQIKQVFEELCNLVQEAGIENKGLFFNAAAGFDSQELRQQCSKMKIEAKIAFNTAII